MREKIICEEIIEKLEDMEESTFEENRYPTDLAFALWEVENINGSCTCSTYESQQWIKENFEDLGEYVEEYFANTGELLNPFSDPESFQVIISIEATANILSNVYREGMTKDGLIDALKNQYASKYRYF